MKKEEKVKDKNKKKNKVIKILLGIGAAVGAIYVANKYVPRFNKKVVKPVKNLANTVKNDIEKSFDEPEQPQCQENHKRFVKENNIQPKRRFDEKNRDRNSDDRINHRNHRRNREQRRERNNFN